MEVFPKARTSKQASQANVLVHTRCRVLKLNYSKSSSIVKAQ